MLRNPICNVHGRGGLRAAMVVTLDHAQRSETVRILGLKAGMQECMLETPSRRTQRQILGHLMVVM
jgi:DNA-binding cell septation regulator SpoVG